MGYNNRGERIKNFNKLHVIFIILSPSQWPRGLRRGSTVAVLLGLWVRTPPEALMSACCVVCCHIEVPAEGWSLARGVLLSV